MEDRNKISRITGLLYLVIVVTGMFSLAYVPKQLFDWNSPARTFENIMANETLFRLSIASSVICYITFIFLPFFLYRLLESTNETVAKIMAILAIISVPISLINLQHKYDILSLIEIAKQQKVVPKQEIYDQTMLFLNQYDNGILIVTVFWGLWLLPFGFLVYKSGFFPKILGVLLMLGCFGYLVNFFGNTLSDNYDTLGVKSYFGLLPAIAEIGMCLWLLLVGAKNKRQV
ncbi:DUF4386 domain-containing protein [Elizabethkingia anophelis]|uniref:DUF4386 domain-containing protein n=1 Tax=Elizabethkingia anophelis TaxID=1117645 RepID=UPI00136FF0A4|nr:DUF4386 domain-containing protein [Elizabethkingia anophelis]MYY43961.1 DUF4386 domain-containing protein [Elizabethkingia anophelis]